MVGFGFQSLVDDGLNLGVGNRPGCAGPRFVDQAFQALIEKALSPLADRGEGDVKFFGNGSVGQAIGGREDDAGTQGNSLCGFGSSDPSL
jgi:hypothetical protein